MHASPAFVRVLPTCCVCVYASTCTCVCMYICTYACTHVYVYVRVTYKGEKLYAAPCASLSGSYRGYDYHAHSLFLRFHSMPLSVFLSGCVRERLPVFNCSGSVLFVSIVHTHKQTHIPNVDPCVHWETKQSSFFVVSFGRRRARNIHFLF